MGKGSYQIPFNLSGSQQAYPQCWYVDTGETKVLSNGSPYPVKRAEGPIWLDNFEFDDTLTLIDYGRGRSSVVFDMQRTDGTKVSVFVSDFFEMAKQMQNGKITGRFTFTKKGQNYGCCLVEAE